MNPEYFMLSGGQSASQVSLNGLDPTVSWLLGKSIFDDLDAMNMCHETSYDGSMVRAAPPKDDKPHPNMEIMESKNLPRSDSIDIPKSMPGAGRLPPSLGNPVVQDRAVGVSEFTKRKNWSQRIIEEVKDFLHVLTPDGKIIYLSPSGEQLTGYRKEELKGRFIVDFIHPDDTGMFIREFNESISSGHPIRFFYRFRKKDDTHTIFESHGHPHSGTEAAAFGGNFNAGFCRGVFMMARPYPTKNAALLDSFLEHKIENQRLLKRISDLRKEEEEEKDEPRRKWLKRPHRAGNPSESEGRSAACSDSASLSRSAKLLKSSNTDDLSMPPPAKPENAPLTKQALEKSNATMRPDSIRDKMARYAGATRIETIEMLTGLKYRGSDRSHGMNATAQNPLLITGDAGIAIPMDKEGRSDKKKKNKFPDEYVCTDCGIIDSPEWRKGPSGPKTLCNACGLRWAKKEKKRPPTYEATSGATIGDSFKE